MENIRSSIANRKKKNKLGQHRVYNFTTFYKATVIKKI